MVLSLVGTACVGEPPPLPEILLPAADSSTSATTDAGSESSSGSNPECGDGQVSADEQCDGASLQHATCESLGYGEGTLSCSDCRFDTAGCGPRPGMVSIPAGLFVMGSSDDDSSAPVREIQLDEFSIDVTETTIEDYQACIEANACSDTVAESLEEHISNGHQRHPVAGISWLDAQSYCQWRGKRLPTEAEWEKAARGADSRTYPWGSTPAPSCARVVMNAGSGGGCGAGSPMNVGSTLLGASSYGVQDLAGNVHEWVADWYGPYDADALDDPTGPDDGTQRVVRGGSWKDSDALDLRVTSRLGLSPSSVSVTVGFRCAALP